MKAKNTPFDMDADDVTMLAMSRLRGSGRLNGKNVDCFIDGYKACMEALYIPNKLIPILQYHLKQYSEVKGKIDDSIRYADLRRGFTEEEIERIEQADKIVKAIQSLIDVLQKN